MRLDKFLSDMGVGSRSELKRSIRKGLVTVDGQVQKDPGADVDTTSEISFDGNPVLYQSFEYYMMNKPAGVISASEDKRQKTVLDLMDSRKRKDLFPAGRLDRDTEGLLLITNDGQLAHRLLSPKHHVDKCYFVRVSGALGEEDVQRFADGIPYDEALTAMPAKLRILESGTDFSTAETTIQEGKFHQIKKMFAALGNGREVVYLKRLSMGPLTLDPDLAPGEYRALTEEELAALKSL